MTPLANLSVGSEAVVSALSGERSFQRRLMEMGFLPGTRVRVVRRNELGGTLELEVRQCRVALRHADAHQMLVRSL